jgi:NADPH:quinone reductase-like Zn-dependent oxidoreductase
MSTQMHAAVLHGTGQAPRYESFPAPAAGAGETVVTVTAAALKPSDRWMARGLHYAPDRFPQVAGLDGIGTLPDGSRVGFFGLQQPYGGMAEQALVRTGMWLPVPDGADDATAAAIMNPGGAAWKTIMMEGQVAAGQTVLVLGATGTSGRIAAQLAIRHGARVVVAGRNQRVLDELVARGADVAIRVDQPREELADAFAAAGPFHLVADYLWGQPAEGLFAALMRHGSGPAPELIRYILVGMTAGAQASVPAIALRAAPVQLAGSGMGGQASIEDAAAGFASVLDLVASGEISVDVEAMPLAEVEKVWDEPGSGRRVVLVP